MDLRKNEKSYLRKMKSKIKKSSSPYFIAVNKQIKLILNSITVACNTTNNLYL